jgi:hypothetical protein
MSKACSTNCGEEKGLYDIDEKARRIEITRKTKT